MGERPTADLVVSDLEEQQMVALVMRGKSARARGVRAFRARTDRWAGCCASVCIATHKLESRASCSQKRKK